MGSNLQTKKSSNGVTAGKTFSAEEQAAMKERAQELKSESRRVKGTAKPDGEADVLAKIAEMEEPDRSMATRLHSIIKVNAPTLTPKTWYGMPAYAKEGKVVCFFQAASKFSTRYATLGFSDEAKLDDGIFWPVTFAPRDALPS